METTETGAIAWCAHQLAGCGIGARRDAKRQRHGRQQPRAAHWQRSKAALHPWVPDRHMHMLQPRDQGFRQQANACTMPRPKYGPLPDRMIQGGVHSATASRQVTPSVLRYTHMCSVKRVPRDPPGAAQHGDFRGEPHFTHSSSARGMTASWARSLTAQRMSLPLLTASRRTLISSSARVAFPKTHRNSPVRKRGAGASKRHRQGTDATRDAETYILISLVP